MSQSRRGPERRRIKLDLAPPGEDRAAEERRTAQDRRRNSYISRLELCRGLPYDEVEGIFERCPVNYMAVNDVLLEPGQANHHIYFLLNGRLDVRLKSLDSPVADVIEVGESVGEMSIIDGKPTSAYVVAAEPSSVIAVHENIFWSKIAIHPSVVRNLSRILAERMRKRNDAALRALEQGFRLEQLQKELQAAYEIQTGMLPRGPALLSEYSEIDVYARMQVVESVGGDFYDVYTQDADHVCVTIGDVSGKGMPAALFMVRALTLLRTELNKRAALADCMNRFNQALCETNIPHMFASLIVLRIDVTSGEVEYVNAGHPPQLLSTGGAPFAAVDGSAGLIAGILEDTEYTAARLRLRAGDRLLLYTDGVTEARNGNRHFYGTRRLIGLLDNIAHTGAGPLVEAVAEDVGTFSADTPQSDDITVVAIEFRGKP